jgi:peptide/nickel transport system substrate-binding protein
MFIVPKEVGDGSVDLRRTQNGTGPWYLSDYIPSVSYTYKRNPQFGQEERGWPYMDQIDMPIITEYAQQLAQLKNGAVYTLGGPNLTGGVRAEDLLATKREVMQLEMIPTDVQHANTRNFFGMLPESPFKDERVRQAWSMSFDRDLFIDVMYNVSKFENEGLPMQTRWDTALPANMWEGWWLDPKGADWAPYYQNNVAEAKKLLAAAGFPNGVDANVRYPSSGYPDQYFKSIELILAMVQEAGFRTTQHTVNFNSEWRPQLADVRGRFEGTSFIVDSGGNEPASFLYLHYNGKGSLGHGFDPANPTNPNGDPTLNDLTTRARIEFDETKRRQIVHDIQKYEAKKIWFPKVAGGANSFDLAWPTVRGRNVWQGTTNRFFGYYWLDKTKAPLA